MPIDFQAVLQAVDDKELILELENLELLDLCSNDIEIIPESIDKLKNIRDLRLAMSVIASLPLSLLRPGLSLSLLRLASHPSYSLLRPTMRPTGNEATHTESPWLPPSM